MNRLIVFLAIIISLGLSQHSRYILVRTETGLNPMQKSELLKLCLDIVRVDRAGRFEIVVHPRELEQIRKLDIPVEVVIEDMERYYASRMSGRGNFGDYYTFSEAMAILDSLHNNYPNITTARIDLGYTTWDGNKVWAMKISDNPTQQENEPEILFTGVHHAREPITCNVAVELIRKLCQDYGSDSEITYLVDNRQIWVVPVVNPDGYLYNEQTNPGGGGMWRKNRRDNGGGDYGVDPNRNYAYQWGYDNSGSSPDPSSETYRGPAPFSEPCTQALRDLYNSHQFIVNVDMHSYSNLILIPWDYRLEFTPDDSLFRELCADMAQFPLDATGEVYNYGTAPEILYACNGTSDDWEYGEQSSKPKCLGFTFEIGEAFWQESEISNHLAEAIPMCLYLIKVVGPWIEYVSHTINDGGNGQLDPGETADMVVTLANKGIAGNAINNVVAFLSTDDNYITIQADSGYYGSIAPGQSGQNSGSAYTITAHDLTPQGHQVTFVLTIIGDGGFSATAKFTLTVGTAPGPYVIYEDDFEYGGGIDSFPNYWNVTGNWVRSTQDAHSPTHSAYSGAPLDNATTLTLKNGVDLTPFNDPQLAFWHRYDFDQGIFMDACAVQISTDGGSSWSDIWTYNWQDGNTLDWTEQLFSLSPYISTNVKVRFLLDANSFFQDYTDWFIDDFIIGIPRDNESPYFTNTTVWPDTSYTGPFEVHSTITDTSGVDYAKLYYRVNNGSWQELVMSAQGNDIYSATIPAQSLGDKIDYYLWAQDNWITPNEGCDPIGAPSYGYYSFNLIVGIAEEQVNGIQFVTLISNPCRDAVDIKFGIPYRTDVSLVIYDVTGRKVKTLIDRKLNSGEYETRWARTDEQERQVSSGIYFLRFSVPDAGFERVEKLILLK